jgi:hypothetical protein
MKVTIFQNFTQIKSHQHISEVLDQIKSDKYKSQVAELQKLVNSDNLDEYNKQKKSLLAFTPSGYFVGGRKMQFLKEYSSLIILDFDKLTENRLKLLCEKIPSIPYTLALFKSPSGNGCKVLVRVKPSNSEITELPPPCSQGEPVLSLSKEGQGVGTLQQFHLLAFNQVRQYYEDRLALQVDPSGKDITRLCFFSYDPDLYYNPEASTYQVILPTLQDDIENVISTRIQPY